MTTLTILTGASRGLGLAMAEQLLRPGDRLLTMARRASDALSRRAVAVPSELVQWQIDLAHTAGAADRLEAWLGQQRVPDAVTLINNAGVVPTPGPLAGAALDELSNALRVGVEAPLLLSAAFLRATAGWGVPRKILNISSGLGRRAMAGNAAYCAAKAGMDHYSRALALEEAAWPDGARVVSLAPGVIDTDMQGQLRGADPALFPERDLFARFKVGGLLDSPQRAAAKVLAWLDRPDFGAHPVADVRDS